MTRVVGKAVGWCILAAVLMGVGNAVVREMFSTSSNSLLEVRWYLFGAAFLLAPAHALRQHEHIRIDILYGGMSRRGQHWIDLLGHLLFVMPFVILMDYCFVPYFLRSKNNAEMSNNSGGLILWHAKLLLLGFVLLTMQGLSEIIKEDRGDDRGDAGPHPVHLGPSKCGTGGCGLGGTDYGGQVMIL